MIYISLIYKHRLVMCHRSNNERTISVRRTSLQHFGRYLYTHHFGSTIPGLLSVLSDFEPDQIRFYA